MNAVYKAAAVAPMLGLALILALPACRDATEITVKVTTDVPCDHVRGVAIGIGELGEIEGKAASSTSTTCVDGRIGALVIVPSGSDDEPIAFRVAAGIDRDFEECAAADAGRGCIVARRALRFLPHTPLTVPVALNEACDGVACTPDTTCVNRACVPATIDPHLCIGAGCPESTLYPDAGVADGGALDATLDASSDATLDAPADVATDGPPVALAVPGCEMGGLEPNAPWPMQGYCPTHRHRSPLRGPKSAPQLSWTVAVQGEVDDQPIVSADGTIYAVTSANQVYALHPDGGAKWTYTFEAGAPSLGATPALAKDGALFVATGEGSLLRIDPSNGNASVVANVSIQTRTDLTLGPDGTVYIADTSRTIAAVAPSGGLRWTAEMDAGVDPNSPAYANGVLYVQTGAGLNALSAADGGAIWGIGYGDGGEGVGEPMVAPSGTIVVGTTTGNVRGIGSGASPSTQWIFRGLGLQLSYSVADDGTTYVSTDNDNTTAIAPDGAVAASYPSVGCGAPVIDADGWLYLVCPPYRLVALDAKLEEKWRLDFSGQGTAGSAPGDSPVIGADGVLYVALQNHGSAADTVLAFAIPAGK